MERGFQVRPAHCTHPFAVSVPTLVFLTGGRSLQALRLLNNGYTPELEERRRLRHLHSDREGIQYTVGQERCCSAAS